MTPRTKRLDDRGAGERATRPDGRSRSDLSRPPVPPRPSRGHRLGFALFVVLLALLLIGAMVAGLFHATLGESQRLSQHPLIVQADAGADYAAYAVSRDWVPGLFDSLAVGDTLPRAPVSMPNVNGWSLTSRVGPWLWWSTARAQAGDSTHALYARRGAHVLWRVARPEPWVRAALTVRDSLHLSGNARVVGLDTAAAPDPWCPAPAPVAAISTPDSARLCAGTCGSGGGPHAAGRPPIVLDSLAADSSTYTAFGSESWASLVRRATATFGPGAVVTPGPSLTGGTQCDRTRADNWGEPAGTGPCSRFSPIIHARGDLEMRGGVGQGILLVDGDLVLSQGARFHGLVIVQDDLLTGLGAGELWGAALARDARGGSLDATRLGGQARVQFSSCALESAYRRSGWLVPVRERAWAAVR